MSGLSVLDVFTRTLFAWQRRWARRLGVADPRTGGVTAVQRFGGAINLNVHFHTLVPDGVFDLSGPGPARFVPIQAPSDEEVAKVLTAVIRKVARLGLLDDEDGWTGAEEDALAALQAAGVDTAAPLPRRVQAHAPISPPRRLLAPRRRPHSRERPRGARAALPLMRPSA